MIENTAYRSFFKRFGFAALLLFFTLAVSPSFAQTYNYVQGTLNVDVIVSNPCGGSTSNGSLTFKVNSANGGGAVLVVVSGPNGIDFPGQSIAVGSSFVYTPVGPQAGSYDFIIRDNPNNFVINTFPAGAPDPVSMVSLPVITITASTQTDNTNCTTPDGQLVVQMTGGSKTPALAPTAGSFTYTWTTNNGLFAPITGTWNGTGNLNLNTLYGAGLSEGTYTLLLEDDYSSCSGTQNFFIDDPSPIAYNTGTTTPSICLGSTGTVTLSNSEGASISYEIYKDGVATGISQVGSNSPLLFTIPAGSLTPAGTYVFTIRAVNGNCTPLFMNGNGTIVVSSPPTTSAAGGDQAQCNNGNFTLAGNAPVIGTGMWSIVGAANGAVITTPASNTSTVTGLTAGNSVTLRWTISNGACPTSTDDVILTNDAPPTVSNAGGDQTQCNNGNFTLAGNSPVIGTGMWSIVGAANGAVITTPASNTSTVTGLTAGNSVTLRWTITNGTCTSTDDVVLTSSALPTTSAAGGDQGQCNNGNFTLAGNSPVIGTGLWSIVGAANGAVITTPASNTSTVTGLTAGNSVTLRWTITNGACTSTDDVILTNSAPPTVSAAGADQIQCNNGNFTLAANSPVTGTGLWSIVGAANGAVITTPASNTSTVTGLTAGNSVTLRWTISNGTCTASTDDVILTSDAPPTTSAAGGDQSKCNNGNFTLAANSPVTGTGLWSIVGAANGAVITTPTSNTSTVTGLTVGNSVTLRWTITNGTCTSTDDVVLTNDALPTSSAAGADQAQCNNGNFTLAANSPVVGTGMWSIVGAANGAVITTPASNTSTVTGLTAGNSVTLRWTITNGICSSIDDVILTNHALPTASAAGGDQTQCNSGNFTLAANLPATGTGLWSIVGAANGAVITTPASNTSTVTGLTAGNSVTLRWTVTNGTCPTSTDDVVLTNDAPPTASAAGGDQAQCNNGNFTLAANSPVIGTGLWSIVGAANGAVITTPASNTSTVTGLTAGNSVTLRWTITNGTCTSADDVILTNNALPTASSAGGDQTQCNSGNFTLAANSPVIGTGLWSIVGAANGAVITTPTSNTSTVTGLTAGNSVTLRWTITNGTCTSTDDVVLTSDTPPTASAAGGDQAQCNNGNFTLAANSPVIGTGLWSIVGAANGAIITTPASNTSTVTGLTVGNSVTLRWTITNGTCTSADDIVLTNDTPPTASAAGGDQTQCNSGNFTLAANSPVIGTGLWSIVGAANGAVITTPASNTSTVTGLTAGNSVTLRWTITNGTCTSTDDVVLTSDAPPTASAAGGDQAQCNSGNFTLAANSPVIGTGLWSIVGAANGAVITTPASNTSTVTGLTAGNSVTLRWTITNGTCAPSTDDVVLTSDAPPTASAAGGDQSQCNSGNFTLAANSPVIGTGLWSIVGAANGAVITTPASNTSTVTGLTAGNSVTLRWTITNGTCTSTDDVILTNDAPPTVSAAGGDQTQCNSGNFTLAANSPVIGTGLWSIVGAANGAVITTPASNTSTVTGLTAGNSVTLRWTITNGTCTSTDDVVLTSDTPPTASASGADQAQCNSGNFTLAANSPVIGTGLWSIVGAANGAIITTPASNTSTVTGLTTGNSVTLRWTITNGTCTSTDDVVLTNDATPTVSAAGGDQAQCNSGNFTLAGNSPVIGTGLWSIVGAANGAVITTPASNTSTVTGLTAGNSVTLRWTISNGTCPPSADDVVLTNDLPPTASNAGVNQAQCNSGNFTLAGNSPVIGTGLWSIVGAANGAVITTPASNTSTVTGLTTGNSVTLRWTITNGTCTSTDDVILTNDATSTVSAAGGDQTQCNSGNFTLAGNSPVIGTGLWSIVGAANGAVITTPASNTSTITGLTAGNSVTLRWTITNGTCTSTDDVLLTNVSPPTTSNAGADQSQCNSGNFTLAGNSPAIGSGLWSIVGVANGAVITTPASNTSTVTGLNAGSSVTLRWTVSNATCPVSTDDVVLRNDVLPTTSNAGPDQSNVCGTVQLNGNVPVVGTGLWGFAPGGNTDGNGNIVSPVNNQSGFNGTPGVTYTLRWRITNGVCAASTDDVQIQFDPAGVTPSNANADQGKCNDGSFTLAGNVPVVGTGTWSIVGAANGASITTPSANNSAVTGLNVGANVTLRWTISNGTCTSVDDVILTNNASPTTAAAGSDQTVCGTSATLAANNPTTGTGAWSIISGAGGTVNTINNPLSTFTGTAGTTYTLRWTITNGNCVPSTDNVDIKMDQAPTVSAAGPDQNGVCGTVTLNANTPVIGTGLWSFAPGGNPDGLGNFVDPTNRQSDFNGSSGITYVLRWTISNGGCTASTDDVQIQYSPTGPTPANAGPDQSICGTTTTLSANNPVSGMGQWSFAPGGNPDALGSIADVNNQVSSFSGSVGQTYTLRWSITSGTCTSVDLVTVQFNVAPTVANAGSDQAMCGTSTTLAANTPVVGTGQWSIMSGAGGTITTPANPTSGFTGTLGVSYTLRWSITNGGCTASTDDVVINFNPALCGGGGGTGTCATVVITPKPSSAQCTLSNGKIIFSIKPFVPAVNNTGVKITIQGTSTTNMSISRTNFNDSIFNALPIGTYSYTIEYGDPACTKNGQVTVDQSGTVGTPIASNIVGPTCDGVSTGTITLDVPGETGNMLEWSLDAGITDPFKPFTAGGQIAGLPAGAAPAFEHVISVRRNSGDPCYASVRFAMQALNPPISTSFNITAATCTGNDGAITAIAASGGSGSGYQFSINGGQNYQAATSFNSLTGGIYTLRVKDGVGCEKDFAANVTFPGFINATITKVNADCTNQGNSGSITVTINDAGTFQLALSTDQFNEPVASLYQNYSNPSVTFNQLARGRYFVYMKSNSTACPTRSSPLDISGIAAITFDIQPQCSGTEISIALTSITGEPNTPFEIWIYRKFTNTVVETIPVVSIPPTASVFLDHDAHVFLQSPNEYQIQIVQVNQTLLCEIRSPLVDFTTPAPLTATVGLIKESYPDVASGSLQVDNVLGGLFPYDIKIDLDSASSVALPTYETDFEEMALNGDQKFEKIYKDIPPGRYSILITDSLGCSLSLIARIPMDRDIYIPNIFTPNDDGVNDVFFVRNLSTEGNNVKLVISNRWGKEVYITNNYQNNWRGEGAADGIYFYQLSISNATPITGWVEILRGQKP